MHRKVGDHALVDEGAAGEIAGERDLFGLLEFDGDPYFDVAGELGVLAGFDSVDGVLEGEAVIDPVGRAVGGQDLLLLLLQESCATVGEKARGRKCGEWGDRNGLLDTEAADSV
jgi:hypothetical protein